MRRATLPRSEDAAGSKLLRKRTATRRGAIIALALFLAGGVCGAQYFGQNKVPGRTQEWRVLESPHIRLHFYTDERETAQTALALAERAYARLARFFHHDLDERIPIVLYASQSEFEETRAVAAIVDEGTGGITEFYKRRVIIPQSGSIAELDHVLTHELVHSFEIDILGRSAERAPALAALSWIPPLWVVEGLAEYLSVPGVDPQTDMWLRDAALSGDLPSIGELSRYQDLRVYRFGQALIAHIAAQFGDDAIAPWFRSLAGRHNLEEGTSESLGITLDRLSDEWADALRGRYFPEIGARPGAESVARRLTDCRKDGASFYAIPSVSPDGREMVYVSSSGLYSDLYLASAVDGGHRTRLIRGYRTETFESLHFYSTSVAWSPDATRLALVAKSGGREALMIYDVRERRVIRTLTPALEEMRSPVWSPDGSELAFVGLTAGHANLYAIASDGSGLRALTNGRWAAQQPAWSPDGKRIAYITDEGYSTSSPDHHQPFWRIALLDLASGTTEILPNQWGRNIDPQWFPDGESLLYLSDRAGVANLYVREIASGRDRPLTDLRNGVSGVTPLSHAVSLAANGERLVFSSFAGGTWDLFALDDPLAGLPPADSTAIAEIPDTARTIAAAECAAGSLADRAPAPNTAVFAANVAAVTAADSLAANAPASAYDARDTAAAADSVPVAKAAAEERAPFTLAQVYRENAALSDTLAASERPYSPRMSIDYASAGGLYASGFGFLAETAIVLSDILGNRSLMLAADVSGSLEEGDYLVSYLNQKRRPAFAVSAYQYWTGYGYGDLPGFIEEYELRAIRGAGVGFIYPLSRFRRVEFWFDGINERRYMYDCGSDTDYLADCERIGEAKESWYVAPEIAWIQDSAIFGSTGPLAGRRVRLSAAATIGERHSQGFEADYRAYLNIRRRYAIAFRCVAAGDWGPDRSRIVFGGPYSLRGFTDHPLSGSRIAFMNLEFRFPFIERLHIAWPIQLAIGGLRGALFFDAGAAWDDAAAFRAFRADDGPFRLEDVKAAAGFRAAINIGFAVIRWDLARRTDLSRWVGKAKGEVSIGWEF